MYACPGCGGGLRYDISSQQLKCDYCRGEFDPYSITKQKDAEEDTDFEMGVTIFKCPQCGGEVMTTDEAITGFCSFCGASTMLDARMIREKRPQKIITFKKTKEDCKKIYERMAKSAKFAPKELKDPTYLEKFRGIYIPYWIYDVQVDGPVAFSGYTTTDLGGEIETNDYDLSCDIKAEYDGIAYDASASFDDHISEEIAPFNTSSLQDFTPSFLAGFYADTSDVSEGLYGDKAVKATSKAIMRDVIGANDFSAYIISSGETAIATDSIIASNNCNFNAELALFPVWFLSYKTDSGRVAYAVVNAETGAITADLPVDIKKYTIGSLIAAIPIFALVGLLFTPTPRLSLIVTFIMAIITLIAYKSEISEIKRRNSRFDDLGFVEKYGNDFGKKEMKDLKAGRGYIGVIIALVVSLTMAIINPVDDIIAYAANIVAIAGVFITLTGLIKRFNILSTRPFPEFLDRKGGNDSAKDA